MAPSSSSTPSSVVSGSPPPHTHAFEDAISVTPLTSHTYQAFLSEEWCIGAVPHGGYVAAVLHRLSTTHFKQAHPTYHHGVAIPISMQITFLRRCAAGPALLTVQDAKLGERTSTIHVSLSQHDELASARQSTRTTTTMGGDTMPSTRSIRTVAYITVSDPLSEQGISVDTGFTLEPPPPPGPPSLTAPAATGPMPWLPVPPQFLDFRRAGAHVEVFGPNPSWQDTREDPIPKFAIGKQLRGEKGREVTSNYKEIWSRFQPHGDRGGEGRWTDEGVAFLIDMFPSPQNKFIAESERIVGQKGVVSMFWFPTVSMNIDFKKPLPAKGVEWLYTRVHTKRTWNGRTDIDVVVLDEGGDIVALSTQVALVLDPSRNTAGRTFTGRGRTRAKL